MLGALGEGENTTMRHSISPLEGEMAGRPEGGGRNHRRVPSTPLCRLRRHLPLKGGDWSMTHHHSHPFCTDQSVTGIIGLNAENRPTGSARDTAMRTKSPPICA